MISEYGLIIAGVILFAVDLYWHWHLCKKSHFLEIWEKMLNCKEAELLERYSNTRTIATGNENDSNND